MRALIATEYVTLDGVMEAPGESDYTIGDLPVRTRATAKSRKCRRAGVRLLLAEPRW